MKTKKIPRGKQRLQASKSISSKDLDQNLCDAAAILIRDRGLLVLLDVCQGTINKVLIQKGIVTSDELRDAYMADITKVLKHSKECKAPLPPLPYA